MPSFVGYARVSTEDQDLTVQTETLSGCGCEKIFQEKRSGTSLDRQELDNCLDYLREGDMLIVTRIDRLARSLRDLQNIVHDLKNRGIELRATEQPIDTATAAGKAFLDMLGVFAEFETNLRSERQMEGIAKAKKAGKYKGRKPTARAKAEKVLKLVKQGKTKQAIADELNVGVASVYRIVASSKNNKLP